MHENNKEVAAGELVEEEVRVMLCPDQQAVWGQSLDNPVLCPLEQRRVHTEQQRVTENSRLAAHEVVEEKVCTLLTPKSSHMAVCSQNLGLTQLFFSWSSGEEALRSSARLITTSWQQTSCLKRRCASCSTPNHSDVWARA